jgi:hypothetical protein
MKLNIFRSMLLIAAAVTFGSVANAQSVNVRATVPFNFVVGDQVYPAGDYSIRTLGLTSDTFLCLRSQVASEPIVVQARKNTAMIPATQTKLVFHRVGISYFLYQVWSAGSDVSREFPKSHTELRMARNGSAGSQVIVAGNLSH